MERTIQAGAVYSLLIGIRGLRAAGILRIARLARGGIVLFIAAGGLGLLCSLLAAEDGSTDPHRNRHPGQRYQQPGDHPPAAGR